MSNSKIVIFDIDGTLANSDHRVHHVRKEKGEKKNWSAFFAEAKNDKPHKHVVTLNHFYAENGYTVVLCTGRPANLRMDTREWLGKHGVVYNHLLMRLTNDRSPDYESKKQILLEFLAKNEYTLDQVEVVFEDKLAVCEAWRDLGLNVLIAGDEWRK